MRGGEGGDRGHKKGRGKRRKDGGGREGEKRPRYERRLAAVRGSEGERDEKKEERMCVGEKNRRRK